MSKFKWFNFTVALILTTEMIFIPTLLWWFIIMLIVAVFNWLIWVLLFLGDFGYFKEQPERFIKQNNLKKLV